MTQKGHNQNEDNLILDKIALIDMEIRELERHAVLTENLRWKQQERIKQLEKDKKKLQEQRKKGK